jgi:hypothetical protein
MFDVYQTALSTITYITKMIINRNILASRFTYFYFLVSFISYTFF